MSAPKTPSTPTSSGGLLLRPRILLGIARAEARLVRRLARFWIFAVLGMLLAVLLYFYFAAIHGFFSSFSASLGPVGPRYMVGAVGFYYLAIYGLFGVVFIGFEIRARDQRERVAEVMDSRPYSNLELLAGRYLGQLFMSMVPLVGVTLLLQLTGWLLERFGAPIGEPMQPHSLVMLLGFLAVPAFTFILGLVYLVSLVVKNRAVAAIVTIVLLAGISAGGWFLPLATGLGLDLVGGLHLTFVSDIVPTFISGQGLLQRTALMLAGLGLVGLSAAVYPRPEGRSRRFSWALGGGLLAVGLALSLLVVWQGAGRLDQRQEWLEAHRARQGEPIADLRALSGEAVIRPGSRIELALELTLGAPADAPLDRLLFSLNPGLSVSSVTAAERALPFEQADGLLAVELPAPLSAGEAVTVELTASGEPDLLFHYLDSTLDPERLTAFRENNFLLLGTDAAIFDRRQVTLLPAIYWLPAPGPDAGRTQRPRDFFDLDLTVELPEGWLAAGPGLRQTVEGGAGGGRVRYRFNPPSVVPEVGLVAGRYTSYRTEVAEVELELLLHPSHRRAIEAFEEAADEIVGEIESRLTEAAEMGLPYPYGALTMVEVPYSVRTYGGGWRMESAMAPPAMLLVRENGLPTTRFAFRFRNRDRLEEREGGVARAKRQALEQFFEADVVGTNPFPGAARNFFAYQTDAAGTDALALGMVTDRLSGRLVTSRLAYFSPYFFGADAFQEALTGFVGNMATTRGLSVPERLVVAATDRPDVWEAAEAVPLAELGQRIDDEEVEPRLAADLMVVKGDAMARSLEDALGRADAARALATLRRQHTGGTFTRADLVAAAGEDAESLASFLSVWLDQADLPGFVASRAENYRLADEAGGAPRYQLRFHLRNREPAPGLVVLRYQLTGEDEGWQSTDPYRLAGGEALEIGLVTGKPVAGLQVAPYLSRNRRPFPVSVPSEPASGPAETGAELSGAELSGARPSGWRPRPESGVVVDDLSAGFQVAVAAEGGLRLTGSDTPSTATYDRGLPVAGFNPMPQAWSRRELPGAYGEYRHTLVIKAAGTGEGKAIYNAELPLAGRFRVELYLPELPENDPFLSRGMLGEQTLTVTGEAGDGQELSFDASAGEAGWNDLGSVELAAGEVRIELSDKTTGTLVVADALRLTPIGGPAARALEESSADDEAAGAAGGEGGPDA